MAPRFPRVWKSTESSNNNEFFPLDLSTAPRGTTTFQSCIRANLLIDKLHARLVRAGGVDFELTATTELILTMHLNTDDGILNVRMSVTADLKRGETVVSVRGLTGGKVPAEVIEKIAGEMENMCQLRGCWGPFLYGLVKFFSE